MYGYQLTTRISKTLRHCWPSQFSDAAYDKYLAILSSYASKQRQLQLIAPSETVFNAKSLSLPISKCVLDNFENVPKERNIYISDTTIASDICHRLCGQLQHSELEFLVTSSGERKISTNISSRDLECLISSSGLSQVNHIKQAMLKHAIDIWGRNIKEAGSILSWLTPAKVTFPDYTEVHCDQLNNNNYDFTLICYLNKIPIGGNFVFVDETIEYHVEPRAGRLLAFDSSIANIHRVMPVVSGNRFALSMWFKQIKK